MMKIIGIAIIAISVIIIGFLYYYKLKCRALSIELFIDLISFYKQRLDWNHSSLKEVVDDFTPKTNTLYIEIVKKNIDKPVYDAFIRSNDYFDALYLQDDEKSLLNHFFENTGGFSLVDELELCEKTCYTLEKIKEQAFLEFKKFGPLCVKLAIVCALWIAIILL